jgi:L-amino acid N-acyltransferase YncA
MNTITYQVERWAAFAADAQDLFRQHWLEIALGHAKVPLDVAHDRYQAMCDQDVLHIVTVRDNGRLVGYHVAIVSGHLHYASTLHGITDVYYLLPKYRRGRTGIRLFQRVEAEMRALGVEKLFTGVKLHTADGQSGRLFEYLGYTPTETLYTKLLGDEGFATPHETMYIKQIGD